MKNIIAVCAVLFLSGCTLGPYAPDYGDATRNNIAVQSVQPPPQAARPVPGNGALAAVAQDRYVTDKVKPPVAVSTSSAGQGNSNGGSGGTSGNSSGP